MSVSEDLVRGKRALLVWHGGHSPEALQPVVEGLREKAGSDGTVLLEHAQRLNIGVCVCVCVCASVCVSSSVCMYVPQCSPSPFLQLVIQPPPSTPFSLA